ncbi:hypothetical protein B0H10DRAFT_1966767 [Mycena sp. CBHHK59/15]|nr:hypothetical protein B0H10DRAFT_1966767 [Mycena sp. CBHHK59/15]
MQAGAALEKPERRERAANAENEFPLVADEYDMGRDKANSARRLAIHNRSSSFRSSRTAHKHTRMPRERRKKKEKKEERNWEWRQCAYLDAVRATAKDSWRRHERGSRIRSDIRTSACITAIPPSPAAIARAPKRIQRWMRCPPAYAATSIASKITPTLLGARTHEAADRPPYHALRRGWGWAQALRLCLEMGIYAGARWAGTIDLAGEKEQSTWQPEEKT